MSAKDRDVAEHAFEEVRRRIVGGGDGEREVPAIVRATKAMLTRFLSLSTSARAPPGMPEEE